MPTLLKELLKLLIAHPLICSRLAKFIYDLSEHFAKLKSPHAESKADAGVELAQKLLDFARQNPQDTKILLEKLESMLEKYRTDPSFKRMIIELIDKK